MASLTQWTWVWVNSGSWWWTGRPGVLPFMGSQRVGHDWATELNWTGQLRSLIALHTHVMRYSPGHRQLCAVCVNKLHLEKPWRVVWGYVVLCSVCCYGCCVSQERINASAVPTALQSLSSCLAYPGFSKQCRLFSVNSKTTGIGNRVRNTTGVVGRIPIG